MRAITVLCAALLAVAPGCADDDDGTAATDTTTTTTATTSTTAAGGALEPCENPDGFTIDMPEDWHTNPGDVVPPCSLFDPEPFEVPEGTDERVAAISASVDRVAFDTVSDAVEGEEMERRTLEIDGRRAIRLSYETTGEGLYPAGTPITSYLVDFPGDGEPATLIVDTVGTGTFDYEANVTVLDRMAATIDIAAE